MKGTRFVLLLSLLVTAGASACATTTVTDEPDSEQGAKATSDDSGRDNAKPGDSSAKDGSTKSKPKKPKIAGIGDSITVDGTDGEMKVKLNSVIDPLPVGEFDTASAGMRFVGVRITLTNTGDTAYDDSPSNGMAIVTTRDEQADTTITTGGTCRLQAAIKIAPGAKRRICVPFEVPSKQKLKTLQFTLDSGFGPQTGEWRLRK
jgi:Domain of unknown function (DUF4352)